MDFNSGAAIDLTGSSMDFAVFTKDDLDTGTVTGVAALDKSLSDNITLVTPTSGIFRIDFDASETDDLHGEYEWECEVTLASGKIYSLGGEFILTKRRLSA